MNPVFKRAIDSLTAEVDRCDKSLRVLVHQRDALSRRRSSLSDKLDSMRSRQEVAFSKAVQSAIQGGA